MEVKLARRLLEMFLFILSVTFSVQLYFFQIGRLYTSSFMYRFGLRFSLSVRVDMIADRNTPDVDISTLADARRRDCRPSAKCRESL